MIGNGFDELNVLKHMDSVYAGLRKDSCEAFSELWMERYLEVWKQYAPKEKKLPDEDELDDLVEMHLAGLLEKPHPVTKYAFDSEVPRKKDRAKESIIAPTSMPDRRFELDKAMRHWLQMTRWYIDFTSQDAEIEAFIDMGAEAVQRHELDDTRTCSECREADGDIYPVDSIPPLPHPACRRWFTPVWSPKTE